MVRQRQLRPSLPTVRWLPKARMGQLLRLRPSLPKARMGQLLQLPRSLPKVR